jgi:hypothetical protein
MISGSPEFSFARIFNTSKQSVEIPSDQMPGPGEIVPRPNIKENYLMRSDLIFGALTHVNNRYELCQLASKATRKLHKPNTRLQDTTNEVLDRFKDTVPMNTHEDAEVAA